MCVFQQQQKRQHDLGEFVQGCLVLCVSFTHLAHEVDGNVGDLVATDALLAGVVRLKPAEPQQLLLLLIGDTASTTAAATRAAASEACSFRRGRFCFFCKPRATTQVARGPDAALLAPFLATCGRCRVAPLRVLQKNLQHVLKKIRKSHRTCLCKSDVPEA